MVLNFVPKRYFIINFATLLLLQVALVVFDNKVQYHGDGGAGSNQLDSGSLDDYNVLMKQGQVFGSDLSLREIQDSLE